jgi:single-strand DNA-binding protein
VKDIMRVAGSGNLTRDVELRSTKSGTQVANLRLAFNTRRPDGQGGWTDKANYVDVEVWGAQAENCAKYLSKGSRVFVDGELDYQEWEDRSSGQKRSILRIRAQTVTFEGGGSGGTSRSAKVASDHPISEAPGDYVDDDIPF